MAKIAATMSMDIIQSIADLKASQRGPSHSPPLQEIFAGPPTPPRGAAFPGGDARIPAGILSLRISPRRPENPPLLHRLRRYAGQSCPPHFGACQPSR